MDKWEGYPALPDLAQYGAKCLKLAFRNTAIFSVCVGKMGHQTFDLKGASQEPLVEKWGQLRGGKPQASHPGFDLQMNRIRNWM
jgi:hypothetical protein